MVTALYKELLLRDVARMFEGLDRVAESRIRTNKKIAVVFLGVQEAPAGHGSR